MYHKAFLVFKRIRLTVPLRKMFHSPKLRFSRVLKLTITLIPFVMISACNNSSCALDGFSFDDCFNEDSNGEWQKIEFVRVDHTGDFNDGNWGHHLFYFPLFNRTDTVVEGKDTDNESSVEVNRSFLKLIHFDDVSKRSPLKLDNRTFSFDDAIDKDEPGAKTASEVGWSNLILPEDYNGNRPERSGVVYDPKTRGSVNNIVNQIVSNEKNLHAFCLNIITGNTKGKYDPNEIEARADNDDAAESVFKKTLDENTYENNLTNEPYVYTFKYTGFQKGDKIKIRIRADETKENGGGLGGIMVSDIHSCCDETKMCDIENECGGVNDCGGACQCTRGETHVNELIPSVIADSSDLQEEQGYYIRGLYTRQVLTLDSDSSSLVMRPRRNTADQQWVFAGSCKNDSRYDSTSCEGFFVNKHSRECLSFDGSTTATMTSGPCTHDNSMWVLTVRGRDEVTGKVDFSGVPKYSIRAKQSKNNYLVARATKTEAGRAEYQFDTCPESDINKEKLKAVKDQKYVRIESRSPPDRPEDHWIFEYQNPGEAVVPEENVEESFDAVPECRPPGTYLVRS